jgi:hypothetical protein
MNNATKGSLAESIELYLAHKHSLGKQLSKVGPMLHWLDSYCSPMVSRNSSRSLLRILTPS